MPGSRSTMRGAVAFLLAAWVLPSQAQEQPQTASLRYAAPEQCPPASAILSEIHRRAPQVAVQIVDSGDADLEITIRAMERGFAGIVRRSDRTERELSSSTCDELASALGLVAALSLVPRDSAAAAPATPAPAATSTAAEPGWEPIRELGAGWRAPVESASKGGVRTGAPRRPGSMHVAVAALIEPTIIAPGVTPGMSMALEYRTGRNAAWEYSLGLGGWYAARQFEDDLAGAQLRWFGARFDACGLLGDSSLRFGPCLTLGTGALQARGEVANPNESTNPWLDLALSGRVLVELSGSIALDLRIGAAAPLRIYSYDIRNPDHSLYTTPGMAGRMSLGLSWMIP